MTSSRPVLAPVSPPEERMLLGLRGVLVGSLPVALLTADGPDRYTVEAVFTRRPEREEIAAILDYETRGHLALNGYSTIELAVSDRRLEIANTNLEELRDGLASVIAARLSEISAQVIADRLLANARTADAARVEHRRAAAVVALVESISFESN
ncbi:hypothetical protein [Schumannella soli]|nr:hypothetical protein [Schumannella soli]